MTDDAVRPQVPPAARTPLPRVGGWLILPLLGLIGSIVSELTQLPDMFSAFGQLGASATDLPAGGWVQFDLILQLALYLAAPVLLLTLMLARKRSFPRNYIRWAIATGVFVVFDLFLGYWLRHAELEADGASFFDYGFLREVIQPISALCIWTPYLLSSERVKNTFVK